MSEADFIYRAPEAVKQRTRIAEFIRREGLADSAALLEASHARPDWFWDAVVRYFEIPFVRPYDIVRDTTAGTPWTRWFVGGTTNVA
jgi:acetyl-CoA synthetase